MQTYALDAVAKRIQHASWQHSIDCQILTYMMSMAMANVVLTTSTRKLMLTGLKLKLPCAFLLKCTSTG